MFDKKMKYAYSKNINHRFNSAESKVREALTEIGFGVLTEINMKDAFKAKLNLDYKDYKILGACNPTLAHKALEYENLIGILMPCNVLIIDNKDGTSKVVFPDAKSLLKVTNNSNVFNLADEVDTLLKKAFNSI